MGYGYDVIKTFAKTPNMICKFNLKKLSKLKSLSNIQGEGLIENNFGMCHNNEVPKQTYS